ncbi:hypothetical protein NC651_021885 [Populus alba x Populus x berolinensis]|nr:hypothetical protein NC651_021885 [Populus alba x Populus x berolinensis]
MARGVEENSVVVRLGLEELPHGKVPLLIGLAEKIDSESDTEYEEISSDDIGIVKTCSVDTSLLTGTKPIPAPCSGKSGKVAFPSRYCTACLMLGLAAGVRCVQSRPSFKTNSISSSTWLPSNLGSTVPRMAPLFQHSSTQSTRTTSSETIWMDFCILAEEQVGSSEAMIDEVVFLLS